MLRDSLIRQLAAYLLLLLFASQFLGREFHYIVAHHHHEDILTCEAAPGDTHLHDERYSHAEDCALCLLPHATTDVLPEITVNAEAPCLVHIKSVYAEHLLFVSKVISLPSLRGPPARA